MTPHTKCTNAFARISVTWWSLPYVPQAKNLYIYYVDCWYELVCISNFKRHVVSTKKCSIWRGLQWWRQTHPNSLWGRARYRVWHQSKMHQEFDGLKKLKEISYQIRKLDFNKLYSLELRISMELWWRRKITFTYF